MRIVAGTLGGRRLTAPPGRDTRPTSEKVREAVFAILGPPPETGQVLDLFAGSGAMAVEALSRGAPRVTVVESGVRALQALRANLRELAVADRTEVIAGDALAFLRRDARRWTWVFLDPPYRTTLAAEALAAIAAGDRLAPDGVIVVEHDRRREPPSPAGNLVRTDQRRYGDTVISFYRRAP